MMFFRLQTARRLALLSGILLTAFAGPSSAQTRSQDELGPGVPMEKARQLSAFGERAAFSPDGTKVAFVDKRFGNAFEVDLQSGYVRNLTSHLPHHGVLRVQYLSTGDYLIVGPKKYAGEDSRANLELFVLDKRLRTGLQPLGIAAFEGVAIGPGDVVAWQQFPTGETKRPGESWEDVIKRVTVENYTGRIIYREGKPELVQARRILTTLPKGCFFAEVQDFRDSGNEVIFYCVGSQGAAAGMYGLTTGIYGLNLKTGTFTPYWPIGRDRRIGVEVEGIAPDGTWTTVECGTGAKGNYARPPIDICRLELRPNGRITKLIKGTREGSPRTVSNSVVSPDGKWVAFQEGDVSIGEWGDGYGIFLMPLAHD